MRQKEDYNLIKGLSNGFCHTWECGHSKERVREFKKVYKEHVDNDLFIRDIQNAPRDARYKIDHYYRKDVTEQHTLKFPYIDFFLKVLDYMEIDETFNWTEQLVNNKSEYSKKDITIGYGDYNFEMYDKSIRVFQGYYIKYKGELNHLKFSSSPKLVDYTNKFWKKYEGKVQYYKDIHDLLHNLSYFMTYMDIK